MLAASSRRNGTISSARTGTPARNGSAASASERTTHTPLPSYPPRTVFSTTGKPPPSGEAASSAAKAATSAGPSTMRCRGHGAPISVRRVRITPLSWACTSASGPGRTGMPSASRARRCSVGTCS